MNDKKFFDKKSPEEENPVEVDLVIQQKYSKLNEIYEEFFEENTISEAKVRFNSTSKILKKKEKIRN